MITLVRCFVYPTSERKERSEFIEDLFPEPSLNKEFRLKEPATEVLRRTFPTYYLARYLDVAPWFINIISGRGYLHISETDGIRADGSIDQLLSLQGLAPAKRDQPLTANATDGLITSILADLDKDGIHGSQVANKHDNYARAYSDVLSVLGRNVSPAQVEEMIEAQRNALAAMWEKSERREAEAWAFLMNKVVGAEI